MKKTIIGLLYILTSLIFLGILIYIAFIKIDGYELYLLFTLPLHIFTFFFLFYGFKIIFSNFYLENNVTLDRSNIEHINNEKSKNKKSKILLSNLYVIPMIIFISFIIYLIIPNDGFTAIWILFLVIISIILYITLTVLIYLFTKNKINSKEDFRKKTPEQNREWCKKTLFYEKTKKIFIVFVVVIFFILSIIWNNIQLEKEIQRSIVADKKHSKFIENLSVNSNINDLKIFLENETQIYDRKRKLNSENFKEASTIIYELFKSCDKKIKVYSRMTSASNYILIYLDNKLILKWDPYNYSIILSKNIFKENNNDSLLICNSKSLIYYDILFDKLWIYKNEYMKFDLKTRTFYNKLKEEGLKYSK